VSASDLLAETEAAISACLKSQAYTIGEREQQRARLSELRELRRDLLQEVQAGNAGGCMATLGQVDYPE
jgi:hypothetical protein